MPIHVPSANALNVTGRNMQLALHKHAVVLFKSALDCAIKKPTRLHKVRSSTSSPYHI